MEKTTVMRLLIIFIFSIGITACNQSPKNKTMSADEKLSLQLGNATIWFQQSAEMEALYLQAYDRAKMLLKLKMDTLSKSDLAPAVVLDLDETVLDNSPFEARLFLAGENYSPSSWEKWCKEAKAELLPGAADFLEFGDSLGVHIFYISNRKNEVFDETLKNLQNLNLPQSNANHLLLRTTTSDKTERRDSVKAGHQILLYIGDNLTDYSQIFADRDSSLGKDLVHKNKKELLHNFIMLANPMYGEWESAVYKNDYGKSASEKIELRKNILDPSY
ncbi:5'-nucleotidase, lipoprotein e(P4) family [Marivirga arenosa]|uniref:5'-nucleotidase, lipoprotein e(P4) family n=1 Tax=Marivirga arenosa TaxID=3059076 RepID=A0AA51N7R6_9BACT|nr:5'-nucleotidase, lipoprotein e(P4) family [Marivirga sp. ABR2-2]WMN06075.1 5'-nucleotidase, lipoprotein e(P4) family [Marivirga sp. ABR2-2]